MRPRRPKRQRKNAIIISFIIGFTVIFSIFQASIFLFDETSNIETEPQPIFKDALELFTLLLPKNRTVPNVVHYVVEDAFNIDFVFFLSLNSVMKIQKPEKVVIWSNFFLENNMYWKKAEHLASILNITLVTMKPTTDKIANDVCSTSTDEKFDKNRAMCHLGGIALDPNMVVLKPLHSYLNYSMTMGRDSDNKISSSVVIAEKEALFLRIWMAAVNKSRLIGDDEMIDGGSLQALFPELINVVEEAWGLEDLSDEIFFTPSWDWSEFEMVRIPLDSSILKGDFSEKTLKLYNNQFSNISDWILFKLEPALLLYQHDRLFYERLNIPLDKFLL